MMQFLFHKVSFQGFYGYSRSFVGAPFFKTYMYVLSYALECVLMYLQTRTYAPSTQTIKCFQVRTQD